MVFFCWYFFFFKQKTAYEMRISDWSSDVCSSDLVQTGEADVLSRTTTWTLTRDTDLGVNLVGTMYYDGQSFMVPRRSGVRLPTDLDCASICITKGTTSDPNTAAYFKPKTLRFPSVALEHHSATTLALFPGPSDAIYQLAFHH